MSVRKRSWVTSKGEPQEAWIVDYVDQKGKRHIKTFAKKRQADAYHATVTVDISAGIHTADSASITVAEAGRQWIATAEGNGLERATVVEYRRHLDLHIVPFLGRVKLSQLNAPMIRDFEDRLRTREPEPCSAAMIKKIRGSLAAILADAQERGLIARNVVRDLRAHRRRGDERRRERRQRGKLKVGIDIPTPQEIKAIVAHLQQGRWRPLVLTAIFTGLRASELRGLRWRDVDFENRQIHVCQRADRFNVIGKPKSEAGERSVPVPPELLKVLREWKLACPKGPLDLVFPNGVGRIENHGNIINRALIPVQIAAGVTDGSGSAKYTGLHALRHFYASWCINRRKDNGQELPLKVVQARLGHASIMMTADTYGHLFPSGDDGGELAAAERSLLA
jgi:integrase